MSDLLPGTINQMQLQSPRSDEIVVGLWHRKLLKFTMSLPLLLLGIPPQILGLRIF